MEKAHDDIYYYERLKAELDKKKQNGQEIDYLELEKLNRASYDREAAEETIQRELAELRKLLNEENNEVVRQGEYERATHIEDIQSLVTKIEMLKFVLCLVSPK